MAKSESIKELATALALAQGAMRPAEMSATNPFLHNRYADLGSVIEAARKPMTTNGLSFTQLPTLTDSIVSVETILMHNSGEWISSCITLPIEDKKGLSLAQSMGAVITYLRRYSLACVLGIYADEDSDGNGTEKPAQKQAPANRIPPTQKAPPPPDDLPDDIPFDSEPTDNAPMTLEQAQAELSSDGKRYGDMPTADLAVRANSLSKVKAPTAEQTRKLTAIQIVIADRNQHA